MAEEITKLTLAIDSTQVVKAYEALDRLSASAKLSEVVTKQFQQASRGAFAGMAAGAAGATTAQAGFAKGTKSATDAMKLSTHQAQQLSFQLHDLFVQIASGQNPFTAFVQQGSQLSGTFGGMGNAVRALTTVFTPLRIAIGGVAGAGVGLAAAFVMGQNESAALQRAIALTGNAAGVTEGQFNAAARSIADATQTTIGSSRDTLQALVASGRFAGDALLEAAKATQSLSKATGRSADDILRDFARAADGPAKFAEQANRSLNFLTAEQLRYIRTLEDQGRTQEALAVTFRALNEQVGQAATKLGSLERAWQGVKNAVSGAADALLSIGRDQTAPERLKQIAAQLTALETRRNTGSPQAKDDRRAALLRERDALLGLVAAEETKAAGDAQAAQRNQVRIAFDRLVEQNLTRQEQLTRALAEANALADRSGASAAERAKLLASITERFTDKSGLSAALALQRARLEADLAGIRGAFGGLQAAFRNNEQVLDAMRGAALVDDRAYFDAKRAFVNLNAEAEERALQQEIARLEQQKATGRDAIEIRKQIATAEAQLAQVRGEAGARLVILNAQESAGLRDVARAFREAEAAQQTFLSGMERGQRRELEGFGLGNDERDRRRGRESIEDHFGAERERAESLHRLGQLSDEAFAAELERINAFQSIALERFDRYYTALQGKQRDWSTGAAEAFRNYADEAGKSGKLAEIAITNALRSTEDALVEFVNTGKLNWKSLADSILADLTRIAIKQSVLGPLSNFLGGSSSTGNNPSAFVSNGGAWAGILAGLFAGGRAAGGPVERGKLYRINEGGSPGEIMNVGSRQYLLAAQNGNVQPQSSSTQTTIHAPINVTVPQNTSREAADQFAATVAQRLQRANARYN